MPEVPVAGPGDDGYHPSMEERVSRVEADIREMKLDIRELKDTTGRLEHGFTRLEAKFDALLPHLATKADISELRSELRTEMADNSAALRKEIADTSTSLRSEMAGLRVEMVAGLAEKPSKTYMWGILAVLLTAYGCGLTGLAVLK